MTAGESFGSWDYLLIAVASIHGTAIAYVPSPKAKAWLLCLPTTFSVSFLALNHPLGVTNVLGLILLLLFTHSVRLLHVRFRIPIIPAIVFSGLGYCITGSILVSLVPSGPIIFWSSCIVIGLLATILLRLQSSRSEPSFRSPLPVMVKLPIIASVILLLLLIKAHLQGFLTLFPMVGIVAAYEARYCLWTISRQIPILMLLLLPMMILIYVMQNHIGITGALIMGWVAFFGSILIYLSVAKRMIFFQ